MTPDETAAAVLVMAEAIEDVRTHVDAWIGLLENYVSSLPPDRPPTPENPDERADRSYAEHELAAMKRDLPRLFALLAAGYTILPPRSDETGNDIVDRLRNVETKTAEGFIACCVGAAVIVDLRDQLRARRTGARPVEG